MQALVRDLNRVYRAEPALWEVDFSPAGFRWLEAERRRRERARVRPVLGGRIGAVARLRLQLLAGASLRLPRRDAARRVAGARLVNTDSGHYGGSGVGNLGGVEAEAVPWHDQPCSAEVTLPPLGVVWLVPGSQRPTP